MTDGRTDRWTDLLIANAVLQYVARPTANAKQYDLLNCVYTCLQTDKRHGVTASSVRKLRKKIDETELKRKKNDFLHQRNSASNFTSPVLSSHIAQPDNRVCLRTHLGSATAPWMNDTAREKTRAQLLRRWSRNIAQGEFSLSIGLPRFYYFLVIFENITINHTSPKTTGRFFDVHFSVDFMFLTSTTVK